MHRNTRLFIIILGVFAAIVVGVNVGRKSTQTTPTAPTPTPSLPQPTSQGGKTHQTCGVQFVVPTGFTSIEIATGGVTLVSETNTKETIIVLCQQDIPRVPLSNDRMENRRVGSASATLYHDASQKDGTPIDKLIFMHPNTKEDVYIAGYGEIYDNFITTITLLPDTAF